MTRAPVRSLLSLSLLSPLSLAWRQLYSIIFLTTCDERNLLNVLVDHLWPHCQKNEQETGVLDLTTVAPSCPFAHSSDSLPTGSEATQKDQRRTSCPTLAQAEIAPDGSFRHITH